jgi:hypothetical protein
MFRKDKNVQDLGRLAVHERGPQTTKANWDGKKKKRTKATRETEARSELEDGSGF